MRNVQPVCSLRAIQANTGDDMFRMGVKVLGLMLVLGTAGTAAAQEEPQGRVKVFLKGGVGDYTGDLGESVKLGPSWGLTLNVQPLSFIGFEVGYEGARNSVEADAIDLALTRHGGNALVKLSLPIEPVKPYAGVGIGITRISVGGDLLQRGDYVSDTVTEVPFVAGIEFNTGLLTAGARAAYRPFLEQNIREQLEDPSGGYFDFAITLGARF
jgi:opacity protein-like surface antigen